MLGAIPLVVVLNDVFDAHKSLLARPDVPRQLLEVAVCLAPAVFELLIVIRVPGDQIANNLVCYKIFPVCPRRRRPVANHGFGRVEVCLAFF